MHITIIIFSTHIKNGHAGSGSICIIEASVLQIENDNNCCLAIIKKGNEVIKEDQTAAKNICIYGKRYILQL